MDFPLRSRVAVLVVCHDFQCSRLIFHVLPHQAVTLLLLKGIKRLLVFCVFRRYLHILRPLALALAIHKQFGRRIVGVNKYGGYFPFPAFPIPMGQDMQCLLVRIPMATVEVVPVLGQPGKVHNAKQGTVAWPIGIIRRRLAQIIESRPHKLPNAPGKFIVIQEIILRKSAPTDMLHIVRRSLVVRVFIHHPALQRKFVNTPRTEGGHRLRSQHQLLGQQVVCFLEEVIMVIHSCHIHERSKTVCHHPFHIVHPLCHRTGRVFTVANVPQETGGLASPFRSLFRNLVPDAPHHYARIVPVMAHQIHHILLRPFVKKQIIPVLAFRQCPFVKRFRHHHEAHLVTGIHELRRRHVVGSADGVASHVLQYP